MEKTYDIVVVGAGIGGLIAAARYLDLHPTASLLIIDRNKHVGGVYSRDRIYPGFHTQFVLGLAEFSDQKMRTPPQEDRVGDCFKAGWLGRYLEEFTETKIYHGTALKDRIMLGVELVNVNERSGNEGGARWSLSYRDFRKSKETITLDTEGIDSKSQDPNITPQILNAHKLIIAAGEYCLPNIPQFHSQAQFAAPIIHCTNFGLSNILSTPNIKHIAILGAGKSSADILYVCLKSLPPTTQVHWIIRASGTGPGFFAPLDLPSPYKNSIEAAQTRAMSMLQPCVFHDDGWWMWFLHRTWLGILLTGWIFGVIDTEAKKRAGYSTRAEAKERGFDKLEYKPGIFWQNNAGGALHHKDFWDVVASRVIVHRADVVDMSARRLHLGDGTSVDCDALLLGTGFHSSLSFLSSGLKAKLGVPHNLSDAEPEDIKRWNRLDNEQDKIVLDRFPVLTNPPDHHLKKANTTPYRLYRGIAPLNDPERSIAFVNHLVSGNMIMNAEAQAHWAVAYLSDKISLPSSVDMEKEVALRVAYGKRRSLSSGQLGNYFAFDMIPYIDELMEDLGVSKVWKRKGTWGVSRPEDLGDAWKAWITLQQKASR